MAMQMSPKDPRKYNFDRDMLWSLHRYFRRALIELGDGSDETLLQLMNAHGIKPPPHPPSASLKDFISQLAAVIADPQLSDVKDPGAKATELLTQLFGSVHQGTVALRTLFSVLFLRGLICEYPLWCAMTRPKHPNDPLPSQDEIEEAAREFLDKLRGSKGDAARDD
jgi:hypothetical protein